MYRFLRARKFSVEAAADMLQSEHAALWSSPHMQLPGRAKEAASLSSCQELPCVYCCQYE